MIADEDPVARRLFEAVWADPAADAPRMVLADYLLERADPMGEMIALQLERARTGDAASDRELELVSEHAPRMFGPAIGIRRWTLERGFLVSAVPLDGMSPEAAHHPLWSTVERLGLVSGMQHPVLRNPHLRALRTLMVASSTAHEASRQRQPLAIRALAGMWPHVGIGLHDELVETFDHQGAFDHVRALSLSAWHLERALNDRPVLDSRLVSQLEHLDLTFTSVRADDVRLWRRWFETSRLARLSVQVPLAQNDPPPGVVPGQQYQSRPTRFVYVEIDRGGDDATVQLAEPTEAAHVRDALAVIGEHAAGRRRLVLQDVADSNRIGERHAALIAGLREAFAELVITTGPVRGRAP